MISDLPTALAAALSAMERDRVGYVLYHQPESKRIVIFVEGRTDVAVIESALRKLGADAAKESTHDFVIPSAEEGKPSYIIELKIGVGKKSSIANLLWLAAIDEGASSARDSLDHAS